MLNLAKDVAFKTQTGGQPRKTVLLVDDDQDFLAQQQSMLEAAGFDVFPAQTPDQAENVLKEHRPDLAVLDVMMERKDAGFVLSHRIKKADPSIPIILVSSVTSETGLDFDTATAEERSWIKADAMLAKPVLFEQLTREIGRLLK